MELIWPTLIRPRVTMRAATPRKAAMSRVRTLRRRKRGVRDTWVLPDRGDGSSLGIGTRPAGSDVDASALGLGVHPDVEVRLVVVDLRHGRGHPVLAVDALERQRAPRRGADLRLEV